MSGYTFLFHDGKLTSTEPLDWGDDFEKGLRKLGYQLAIEYYAGGLTQKVFQKEQDHLVDFDLDGGTVILVHIHGLLDFLEFTRLYLVPIVSMNALQRLAELAEEHDTRAATSQPGR